MMLRSSRSAMVIRLSRDDMRTPGNLEEKALRHEAIARELAERHSLTVAEDYTFRFLELSGRKLINVLNTREAKLLRELAQVRLAQRQVKEGMKKI